MPKERHNLDAGVRFLPWLEDAGLHQDIEIVRNGKKLEEEDEVDFELEDGDFIRIFDQPKEGGLVGTLLNPLDHLNPIKFTQKILSSLIKQPNLGATADNSKTSPNNSLKGQTNIARNGEAKPDNYGQVRAFPDLIQESMFEYVNNIKKVTEWMNFGLGKYDVTSVRFSESNLGSLEGASYRIYQPGEVIPQIIEGFAFDDIDGQELPGPNESDQFPIKTATTTTGMVSGQFTAGQALIKIQRLADFTYFYDLTKPHSVSFVVNVTYGTVSGPVTKNITVYADLVKAVTTTDGAVINPQFFYEFTFSNLSGNDIALVPADATINTTIFTLNDNEALTIGPSFSPVAGTELWVHLNAQLGHGDWARANVTFWKVNDDNVQIPGTNQTVNIGLNNDDENADNKYGTFKITPAAGEGRYAVSFVRTNNSNDHSVLTVEAVHSVRTRNNVTYPNDTLVTVTVTATENATSQRDRKYNALITRHTISYNIDTRTVDYNIRASRSFADAVLHTWLVMGKQPESSIDIYELYSISQSLPDARLGYFDYTFDDEDISLGARVQTICDAATVTAFWDDGVLSFTRDEKKANAATVFNRSNTKAQGVTLSYDMTLPGGFDGVEVQYRNPTTNKQAFIRYKIVGNVISKGEPVKAKKFDMLYIRNSFQADDRAVKEVRRLLYSRISTGITALADGEWVNVGEMVQVSDMYDINQQDGYITERIGDRFDTSEKINFDGEMYVVVTDSNGTPSQRVRAYPRSDTAFGFIAAVPNISLNIWDGENVQSPSRFIIATQLEMDATKWVITEKRPSSDGTTGLTASEYSDAMYDYVITE
jgi:hypothetical protein